MKITKKTKFSELMKKPEAAQLLMQKGLMCIGCPMSMTETLEQGAKAHGLDAEKLITELNDKLGKKPKKKK